MWFVNLLVRNKKVEISNSEADVVVQIKPAFHIMRSSPPSTSCRLPNPWWKATGAWMNQADFRCICNISFLFLFVQVLKFRTSRCLLGGYNPIHNKVCEVALKEPECTFCELVLDWHLFPQVLALSWSCNKVLQTKWLGITDLRAFISVDQKSGMCLYAPKIKVFFLARLERVLNS